MVTRVIKDAQLYEISFVVKAANPHCRIISVDGVPR